MKKLLVALLMVAGILGICGTAVAQTYDINDWDETNPATNYYPTAAYELAITNPNAYILDIRTTSEWTWVGRPGPNKLNDGNMLTGKVVNVPYWIEKNGVFPITSRSFISDINELFPNSQNVILLVICRSGQRSQLASLALQDAGYTAINVLTGFEGDRDSKGYRTVNGWINDGLPYVK